MTMSDPDKATYRAEFLSVLQPQANEQTPVENDDEEMSEK